METKTNSIKWSRDSILIIGITNKIKDEINLLKATGAKKTWMQFPTLHKEFKNHTEVIEFCNKNFPEIQVVWTTQNIVQITMINSYSI